MNLEALQDAASAFADTALELDEPPPDRREPSLGPAVIEGSRFPPASTRA
jgi:hypothetical protein